MMCTEDLENGFTELMHDQSIILVVVVFTKRTT